MRTKTSITEEVFLRLSLVYIVMIFCTSNSVLAQETWTKNDFINPPSTIKVHTWWHWIDGAITKEGITRDLESMQHQGISQATILNVSLFEGKNFGVPRIAVNSNEWGESFQWALQEANRLGVSIGAHNCDGWSTSGGPWITPEKSMKQYVWTKEIIAGGKTITTKLKQPLAVLNYYKDVAVVAFKSASPSNSFQIVHPKITINDTINTGSLLTDGNPTSGKMMNRGDYVQLNFVNQFTANQIVIHPRRPFMWRDMSTFKSQFSLLTSDDGKKYIKLKDIEIIGLNKSNIVPIPETKSRFYRLQLTDFATVDPEFGLALSEVELLKTDEKPLFSPSIPFLLEKTACIKTLDKTTFDIQTTTTENKIDSENSVIDLTKNLSVDGVITWKAPVGNWTIIRFGYTTTGSTNQPATKEGLGLECDKMDTAALDIHLQNYPQKLIDLAGKYNGNTFKFFLIDSWEAGYQNWTGNFVTDFKEQNGYDIIKWIPVLCGETIGSTQLSEGFLYDFRKTIASLIEKKYYKHFSEWCHKKGLEMHTEVIYGGAETPPIDVLKTNIYADVPMWEFWAGPPPAKNFPEPYVPSERIKNVLPIFAANCYQLPIVAAESYTGWAHYSESPFYLKPFGDRAFCTGVNQLILHSYVHQPMDKAPGLTLGRFGGHYNRLTPWWSLTSDWFTYQNRVQYLLQKGETISDVLYFLGDQFPQFTANKIVNELPFGYRANGCNQDVLLNKLSVKSGKIILSAAQEYSILVLPDNPDLELKSLTRIADLVNQGAVVYGSKPQKMLSLNGNKNDTAAFEKLANQLWGNQENVAEGEHIFGKGKVIWGKPIETVLNEINAIPGFQAEKTDFLNLQYIHKKLGSADLYFVANQQNSELTRECVFRIKNKIPQIWNAQNGTVEKVTNYSNENNLVRIPVTFKPYESLIFVFDGDDSPHHLTEVKNEVAEKITISDFKGTITFSPVYAAQIPPVTITDLKSWTDFADPNIKYFSGKATYTIHFKVPKDFKKNASAIILNLGKIEAVGGVTLNKKFLGNIWLPDFKLDVTSILQEENELEVTVVNTYRNRIIGDFIEYGKLQNIWTTSPIEKYLNKDSALKPSGLIGSIKLIKSANK